MQAKLVSSSFAGALLSLLAAIAVGGLHPAGASLPLLLAAAWLLDFGYYALLLDRQVRRRERQQWQRMRGLTLPVLLRWEWQRRLLAVRFAATLDLLLACGLVWWTW